MLITFLLSVLKHTSLPTVNDKFQTNTSSYFYLLHLGHMLYVFKIGIKFLPKLYNSILITCYECLPIFTKPLQNSILDKDDFLHYLLTRVLRPSYLQTLRETSFR